MNSSRFVYWRDGDFWLGYLEDYPDYMTQGMSHEELVDNLKDIYTDIVGGLVPCVRQVGELQFA